MRRESPSVFHWPNKQYCDMQLSFDKYPDGLLPAVVQDARTRKVLMLGYMNAEALARTQATGRVTFFSRSRQCLWEKGATSGNFLTLVELLPDCDRDALLVLAVPAGPTCHTGADSCFREDNADLLPGQWLPKLETVVRDRLDHPSEGSYVSRLAARGIRKIAQKVGEEAVEVVLEAESGPDAALLEESADLLFHLLVLLQARGLGLAAVEAVLRSRMK
jgi:phosphoribosyl-ATP pyrophosphohydrolase/phosphoribosyl-AMP cyclohydrolase